MNEHLQTVFKTWRTGLYGETAETILWWTVRGMRKLRGVNGTAASYLAVARGCDNEITIVARKTGVYSYRLKENWPYDFRQCSFSGFDDKEFREYLASQVKRSSKGAWSEWKRDSGLKLDCAGRSLTVSEAYAVYDALKGRDIKKHFPAELVGRVAGTSADPMTVELETARRDAREAAMRRYRAALDKIQHDHDVETNKAGTAWFKARKDIEQRRSDALAELESSIRKELDGIDKDFGADEVTTVEREWDATRKKLVDIDKDLGAAA